MIGNYIFVINIVIIINKSAETSYPSIVLKITIIQKLTIDFSMSHYNHSETFLKTGYFLSHGCGYMM